MTESLVQAFSSMQPTGFGNPAPVFCVRGVHTTDVRAIGKEGAHLRMRLVSGSDMRNAIGFRMGDRAGSMPEVVEAVVGLSINEWQDRRSVQCELRQFKAYLPAKAFLSECQRRESEIDAAMLGMLSRHAGRADVRRIERMTLEEAKKVLSGELLTGYQGTTAQKAGFTCESMLVSNSGNRIVAKIKNTLGGYSIDIFDFEDGVIRWEYEYLLD